VRVRRGGVNVRVNLVWKITRRGLVVQAAGTQRRDKARVGRAVVPVRVGVHGGESKLTQRRDGFYIPAPFFFIFPSCNIGFEQNKPKFDSLPFCKTSHPF